MASGPTTAWPIEGEKVEVWKWKKGGNDRFPFLGLQNHWRW